MIVDAVFSGDRMKLVRFNSPEVANDIASAGALACWGSRTVVVAFASGSSLLLPIVLGVFVSVRAAVWIGVPIFFAMNLFYLWRGSTPRLNWVIAGDAGRLYVRLFARRRRNRGNANEANVMVLKASEIASISARTIEVFVHGPKPKVLEWLVIEPAEAVVGAVADQIRPLQPGITGLADQCSLASIDSEKLVFVGNQEGSLTIEWKYCRPALRMFLQQVAQQCPSIVVAPASRSELDLNWVWNANRWGWKKPDPEQRQMLAHAIRLGFGGECVRRLSLYKGLSRREALKRLAELESDEAGNG